MILTLFTSMAMFQGTHQIHLKPSLKNHPLELKKVGHGDIVLQTTLNAIDSASKLVPSPKLLVFA